MTAENTRNNNDISRHLGFVKPCFKWFMNEDYSGMQVELLKCHIIVYLIAWKIKDACVFYI